jgi:hypothetical protein
MEWPTRECGNTASVQACNLRPPWLGLCSVIVGARTEHLVHVITD